MKNEYKGASFAHNEILRRLTSGPGKVDADTLYALRDVMYGPDIHVIRAILTGPFGKIDTSSRQLMTATL